jgi:hypothetical protein
VTAIPVELGARRYEVLIEAGGLDRAADLLAPYIRDRLIVVTDTAVAAAQLARLQHPKLEAIVLPSGEATKSWAQLEALCDRLLALEVERGEHIVALGGGVIGDLTGFAAAILKRGMGFVQVPTSLLAQVDSSVGGKTAINARAGKNLIGAFHQPSFVLIDPTVLDTLPQRELRAGYAEIVKYGLIDDPDFFVWCEAFLATRKRAAMRSPTASPQKPASLQKTSVKSPTAGHCSIWVTHSATPSRRRPASGPPCSTAKQWRPAWRWPSGSPHSAGSATGLTLLACVSICRRWDCPTIWHPPGYERLEQGSPIIWRTIRRRRAVASPSFWRTALAVRSWTSRFSSRRSPPFSINATSRRESASPRSSASPRAE